MSSYCRIRFNVQRSVSLVSTGTTWNVASNIVRSAIGLEWWINNRTRKLGCYHGIIVLGLNIVELV